MTLITNLDSRTAHGTSVVSAAIDAVVAERSVLKHPFYVAWQEGTLTPEALRDYATEYYHHVSAFPTYLSALHSRADDLETRQALLENLIEEERGEDNHPELWMRFAEGIGCSRSAIHQSVPRAATVTLIETFRTQTGRKSIAAGLAALYAYESQMPAVSATKIDGLKRYYGINDPNTLAYFKVHAEADVRHSEDERSLLNKHAMDDSTQASAVMAATAVTTALWNVLSDVSSRHGIAA